MSLAVFSYESLAVKIYVNNHTSQQVTVEIKDVQGSGVAEVFAPNIMSKDVWSPAVNVAEITASIAGTDLSTTIPAPKLGGIKNTVIIDIKMSADNKSLILATSVK